MNIVELLAYEQRIGGGMGKGLVNKEGAYEQRKVSVRPLCCLYEEASSDAVQDCVCMCELWNWKLELPGAHV